MSEQKPVLDWLKGLYGSDYSILGFYIRAYEGERGFIWEILVKGSVYMHGRSENLIAGKLVAGRAVFDLIRRDEEARAKLENAYGKDGKQHGDAGDKISK